MKLSDPAEASDPCVIESHRALQNPPLAVPSFGMPSYPGRSLQTEFLLVCEARSTTLTDGHWRFGLEDSFGETVLEAEDSDLGDLNRLTLLAAVRGLEAIDGPSSVTLLSTNRYLIRSLSNSLPRWRQNNFVWEHFGRRVAVQHADLWRRVDRALDIHTVQACLVSSCLVSRRGPETQSKPAVGHGTEDAASTARPSSRRASGQSQLRIDRPVAPSGRNRIMPFSGGTNTPENANAPNQSGPATNFAGPSIVPAPSARLRRLLASDVLAGNPANSDAVQNDPDQPSSDGLTSRRAPTAKRRGRFTAEDLHAE